MEEVFEIAITSTFISRELTSSLQILRSGAVTIASVHGDISAYAAHELLLKPKQSVRPQPMAKYTHQYVMVS